MVIPFELKRTEKTYSVKAEKTILNEYFHQLQVHLFNTGTSFLYLHIYLAGFETNRDPLYYKNKGYESHFIRAIEKTFFQYVLYPDFED